MTDYTPTEARVCIDFCNAAVKRRQPDGSFMDMEDADAAFSRWLAAHDAEVRAAVCTPTDDEIRAEYLRRWHSSANVRSPYDADLMMAGFAEGARWAAERAAALREPEWEYGWRSFFDDGEEYEWLACSSRADAEKQIKAAEAVEDRVGSDGDDHLTYSLWRREVREPGPWQPVPADETGGSGRDRL